MKFLAFIISLMALLILAAHSFAFLDYELIQKKDTSYSNVKRGAIYISVPGSYVPNERELKEVSSICWEKHRGS